MTRSEAYALGYAEGVKWAERDIMDAQPVQAYADELRALTRSENACRTPLSDTWVAECLGRTRAYRWTLHRYDVGEHTRAMFYRAPVGR